VTDRHPDQLVSPDTWDKVSCGSVVSQPKQDGAWVVGDLQINKKDLISKVDKGDATETSAGYQCRTEMVSGVTDDGEHYDAIQRDIRYNHVALGPMGWARAGRDSRLRLDSNAAVQGADCFGHRVTLKNFERVRGMKFRVDGVEYDTTKDPDAAKQAFDQNEQKHKKKLDEKDTEISGLKTKLDEKDGEISKLQKKLDEKPDIPKLVKARVSLVTRATKFTKIDGIDDMSDRDVMVATIKSTRKDFDPEGKSDDYISGVFESLSEPKQDTADTVRQLRSSQPTTTTTTTTAAKPAYQRPLAASRG
jgi:hypothetical protein